MNCFQVLLHILFSRLCTLVWFVILAACAGTVLFRGMLRSRCFDLGAAAVLAAPRGREFTGNKHFTDVESPPPPPYNTRVCMRGY